MEGKTAQPAPALRAASARRVGRVDGENTRQHILQVAGQVFAERGLAHATSKEICERAGTNMAAVNYHFGGRDELYQAVLVEAHRQIVSVEELAEAVGAARGALARLRTVLGRMLGLGGHGSVQAQPPWGYRVILREVMSPSPQLPAFIQQAVMPKAALLRQLVAEIVGLPPAHPAVQRCLLFTVLPCIVMVLAPPEMKTRVLPALQDGEGMLDELMRYVGAGLAAVGRAHRRLPAGRASR